MLRVRNVMRFRIWRDHNQWYPETIHIAASPLCAPHPHLRRRNVVVPASPIVPCDEDGRVRPIGAVADSIYHRSYPRWPGRAAIHRVIGILAARNHPADVLELVVGNVGKYLLLIEDHIVGP